MDIIDLPFDIYDTFIVEKKYGFNKIKPVTFFIDFLKDWLLTILIGAPILATIFYIFISLDKTKQEWESGLKKTKIPGSHYMVDENFKSVLAQYFGINSIPRYVIINKNGKLDK